MPLLFWATPKKPASSRGAKMYNGFIANKFMGLGGFGGKKVVGVGCLGYTVLLMISTVMGWMNVPAVPAHKKNPGSQHKPATRIKAHIHQTYLLCRYYINNNRPVIKAFFGVVVFKRCCAFIFPKSIGFKHNARFARGC